MIWYKTSKYLLSSNILAISMSERLTANSICRTALKKLIAGGTSILMVTNIGRSHDERTNERDFSSPRDRAINASVTRALINFRPNKVLDIQPRRFVADAQFSAAICDSVKDIGYERKMRGRAPRNSISRFSSETHRPPSLINAGYLCHRMPQNSEMSCEMTDNGKPWFV